ncbi:Nedd8-activating enzyme E1 catalytic subunit [Babesia sp. Xinjiang]|uniref:Nedd8-activating enzyme E1 catalytic subunit n=1 Tax=Babesia sp. Xinjiang TaxID=462227 RepID=UPI000A2294C0|nr:Nedd8-activating enzyme E1 catalytic subunit [Babesia sp. Xinjiang]ORM42083.1 Nedd8-activating enzyme E1 catalytic subunit [Babesia sp. Xinjiang]
MNKMTMENILLVGAGGLGCEVIKNLLIQGIQRLTIVDPDIIELHNLTRQFIFRYNDVGANKAQTAAQRIKERFKHVEVIAIPTPIQELQLSKIAEFDIIISVVDNIQARRWINLTTMVIWQQRQEQEGTKGRTTKLQVPLLIDGGSQELFGHVRVVGDENQPCLECSLPLFADQQVDVPSCSIPREPKTPEDCVRYVLNTKWEDIAKYTGPGQQDVKVIEKVLKDALQYAAVYKIHNVTRELVRKILNNDNINVNTTNAIVAAVITNIILKREITINFYFYSGEGNTVFDNFIIQKHQDCFLCQGRAITLNVDYSQTLQELIDQIETHIKSEGVNITTEEGTVYMASPEGLQKLYRNRLGKPLRELRDVLGERLYVTTRKENMWYCVHLEPWKI